MLKRCYRDGDEVALSLLIKSQLSSRAGRIKKKLGESPRWVYPLRVEVQYRKLLLALVAALREEAKRHVLSNLPRLIAQARVLVTDSATKDGLTALGITMDSWSGDLDLMMSALKKSGDELFPEGRILSSLATIGRATDSFNKSQWYKICKKVLGVDIFSNDSNISARMESFVHDNTALIKDVKEQVYKDVRIVVSNGIQSGQRYETIAQLVISDTKLQRGVFKKVETRAAIIARDQVSKLNGDLASYRQQAAGGDEYTWRTVQDERVVGTPGGRFPNATQGHGDHFRMNGVLCKWSNSNVLSRDGGKSWVERPDKMKGAIPGSQYCCRCYADMSFDELYGSIFKRKQEDL